MSKRRLVILQIGFLMLAGIAFFRLFQLQVFYHNPLSIKAAQQTERISVKSKPDFAKNKAILIQHESAKVTNFLF